ncbi:MAG: glutaredoxin [bacterium]
MNKNPVIIAYLKPTCGWSMGVRAVFKKYGLKYEDKDIIGNRDSYREMVEKSGQPLSPCVQIDGTMLPDVSGDEVEAWMIKQGYVAKSDAPADAPTNAACAHEELDPASLIQISRN